MARSGSLGWMLLGGAVFAALELDRRHGPSMRPRPEPVPPDPLASGVWTGPVVELASGAHTTFTSPFGARATADDPSGHLGIDLGAPTGTPVRALASGVVVGHYPDPQISGYGNLLVVDHGDDTAGLYAHLDSFADGTERGARVAAGQLLGTVGSTNSGGGFRSSPPHLHLEILRAAPGERMRAFSTFRGGAQHYPERDDPAAWAAARGVRLV